MPGEGNAGDDVGAHVGRLSQTVATRQLELAFASALRKEPKIYEQVEALRASLPRHAVAQLKQLSPLLAKRDQAVDSALEELVRRLLRREKLPEPALQHEVFDGNAFVAKVDFAWPNNTPRVVLQAHGERYHGNTAQWRRDLQQVSELNELGWRVIQCTMSDVTHRPARLAQMLRRSLAGHQGDGRYRDAYLRDVEADTFPGRGPRR